MRSQQEKIKNMSDRDLRFNLYITQALILFVCIILSYWLFDDIDSFLAMWQWKPLSIVLFGGGVALVIILIDYVAMRVFPESWFDDGGINERMFRGLSIPHLLGVTLLIGTCEELLFRGILQTHFGLVAASVMFAVLHVRYIAKPFLFSFVLVISIAFGYLFAYTGNLLVTIFAHFLVDFVMGLYMRRKNEDML